MRYFVFLLVAVSLLFCSSLFGQGTTSGATATCNFGSSRQVAVEYQRMTVDVKKPVFGEEIPYDKVWAPGGKPLALFLNSPVTIGGKEAADRRLHHVCDSIRQAMDTDCVQEHRYQWQV